MKVNAHIKKAGHVYRVVSGQSRLQAALCLRDEVFVIDIDSGAEVMVISTPEGLRVVQDESQCMLFK